MFTIQAYRTMDTYIGMILILLSFPVLVWGMVLLFYCDIKYYGNTRVMFLSYNSTILPGFPLFSKYQIPGFLKVFGLKFQACCAKSQVLSYKLFIKNLEMC